MDCFAAEPSVTWPGPPDTAAAPPGTAMSATLCMNCEVRTRCLGGVAAQAGTAQLAGILAGRRTLRMREVLYRPGDRFEYVFAVRSGSLVSTICGEEGEQVVGFHFPGEVVGVDGMAGGRQRVTLAAMEETQLCAVRFAPRGGESAGVRSFLARLWDMMSCELVRERTHQTLFATMPPERRVAAFLASVAGRMRTRAPSRLPPGVASGEIANYLRVPQELVQSVLESRWPFGRS